MANHIKGRAVVIKVADAEGENYIAVAGQQGGSLSREVETVDVSSKDSEFNEYELGQLEWSVSLDGLVKLTDDGFKLLEEKFMAKEEVMIQFEANGNLYTGMCMITSLPLEFGYEDMVTYSAELQGTGTLDIQPKA